VKATVFLTLRLPFRIYITLSGEPPVSDYDHHAGICGFYDAGRTTGIRQVVEEKLPDGYYDEYENQYITGVGEKVVGLHPEKPSCKDGCVIHSPSEHGMRGMKTLWRDDRAMMERLCEHNVGHPDPDQVRYWHSVYSGSQLFELMVHGCCGHGCCHEA
jgi:hypothetical protein